MEEEKKNKLKKILSYIGCGIGCFILGLCVSNCANNKGKKASNVNNNTQNEVVNHNVDKKGVVIDNEDDAIIFSVIDLNDYSWPSLCSVASDLGQDIEDFTVNYNNVSCGVIEVAEEYVEFSGQFATGYSYVIDLSIEDSCWKFGIDDSYGINYQPFEHEVKFYINTSFDSFVNAIEEDIEYNNEHYQQSIFGGLTESLVDFIGVIGSGFTSVFTIFYASGHITTFGTLSLIVVGVAIAYFLFRFIIGLIRLRG